MPAIITALLILGSILFLLIVVLLIWARYQIKKNFKGESLKNIPEENTTLKLRSQKYKGGFELFVVERSDGQFKAFIDKKEAVDSFYKNALYYGAFEKTSEKLLHEVSYKIKEKKIEEPPAI